MDDKKKEHEHEIEAGLVIIVVIAILIIAWSSIEAFFRGSVLGGLLVPYQSNIITGFSHFSVFFRGLAGILIVISFPLSLFFFIGIIYCIRRLQQIRHKERQIYDLKVEPAYEAESPGDQKLAARWEEIKKNIASENPNDWNQAIIQADIILDDILTKMGYRGESIGEKLKRVEKGDMQTLDDAWAAHKVRNDIAHEVGFTLTQHEAIRTFNLYKKVFEEFYYV